jgi:hypothetical protein
MFYRIIVSLLYKVTLLFSIVQIILALFHSEFANAQSLYIKIELNNDVVY